VATVPWVEQVPAAAPAAGVSGFAEGPSPGVKIFKWASLAAADDGVWLPVYGYSEVAIEVFLEAGGAFGNSSVAIQCALEYGTPAGPPSGAAILAQDVTGADVTGIVTEKAEQLTLFGQAIRPKLTGATGTGISVIARLSTTRAGRRG
jgi:hypothetical protein